MAEDNPVFRPDNLQPLIILHVVTEFIRRTVVVLNIKWSLHFQQRLGKPLSEATVKIEGQ